MMQVFRRTGPPRRQIRSDPGASTKVPAPAREPGFPGTLGLRRCGLPASGASVGLVNQVALDVLHATDRRERARGQKCSDIRERGAGSLRKTQSHTA